MLGIVVRAALALACALLSLCGALVWLDLDGVGARHGGVPPRLRPHRPLPIRLANFLLGPWREALIPLQVQGMVSAACTTVVGYEYNTGYNTGYTGTRELCESSAKCPCVFSLSLSLSSPRASGTPSSFVRCPILNPDLDPAAGARHGLGGLYYSSRV
jgi:hypothetical protein